MSAVKIVGLCIVSAIVYGLVHDQITARVCLEYFTIGHPRVFPSESPTLLALGWGIIATWWCGLILGVPLAVNARLGSRPKLEASDFLKPIAIQLAFHHNFGFYTLIWDRPCGTLVPSYDVQFGRPSAASSMETSPDP